MRYTRRNFKYDEGSPMERLQELENKLDDGTLLEPPCKIGDKYYSVLEDYSVLEELDDLSTYKIFEDTVKGFCLENNEWYVVSEYGALWRVGSDDCIFDYEEAKARLQEKQEGKI